MLLEAIAKAQHRKSLVFLRMTLLPFTVLLEAQVKNFVLWVNFVRLHLCRHLAARVIIAHLGPVLVSRALHHFTAAIR